MGIRFQFSFGLKGLEMCAIVLVEDTCAGAGTAKPSSQKNDKACETAWDVRTPSGQSPASGARFVGLLLITKSVCYKKAHMLNKVFHL